MAKTNWFWPPVDTKEGAKAAAKQGVWAAVFVAVITAAVATIAMSSGKAVMGVDAWAYADAVLFAALGFGIYKMSRFAAVAALVLYVAERIYMMASSSGAGRGFVLTIIFTLFFLNAVRGTFAFKKLSAEASAPQPASTAPPPLG